MKTPRLPVLTDLFLNLVLQKNLDQINIFLLTIGQLRVNLSIILFSSFDGLLRDGYYPGYFLFINIDPTKIDVNVHPNKTEIKFDDDQNLYSIINSAVKHCLGIYQVSPVLDFDKDPQWIYLFPNKTYPKFQVRSGLRF